jgi:hypothetical protein
MLHDPARHEPLVPIAWDADRARATITRIVDATVAAFSPVTLWPIHPLDLDPDDPAATCFYCGAGGIVWALEYLNAVGAATSPSIAAHLGEIRDRNRSWLAAAVPGDNTGSYLLGELPFEMMVERGDTIARLIEANVDHPARELMWGSPGSLLAAAMMHRRTGEPRWAALFQRIAQRLREQRVWSEPSRCYYWSQARDGRDGRYLDAVHGFVATARALLLGRHLLAADDWAEWQRCIETTITNTAIREHGMATWPAQIDEPPDTRQKWLMQFCHGAPGFVVCLADLPGTALDELLVEAGEATWAAGPLVKGSNLCHGTAGNGYAFLVLYARTADPRWRDRARAFAMHAIGQFEAASQPRHSLWTGDIGLAVFLWDCLRERAAFPMLDVFFG